MRRIFGLMLAIGLIVGNANMALAEAPATQRALRNIALALSLEIAEPFKTGTIPPGKEFDAKTLVKDLDDRLRRARNEFDRIDAADKSLPSVVEISRQIEETERIHAVMKVAVDGQEERAAQAKAMHFAFQAEFETYHFTMTTIGALVKNREADVLAGASPERLKQMAADLAAIAEGCREKYKGIQNHPVYSLGMLQTSFGDWRQIAAMRDSFLHRAVLNHVGANAGRMIDTLKEIKKSVESKNGFLSSYEAKIVNDPAEFRKRMADDARPWFAAIGRELPEGYFAPVEPLIAATLAAVDSAAPTWPYPDDKYHDAKIDGIVRKQMASGVTVLRTSLTFAQPTIFKNDLGIILSRARSGHILYKMPGAKWCSLRSFDYVEEYAGGGTYATPSSANLSEAVRFQASK